MMRLNIRVVAPIPLVKVETPEPAKGEYLTLKLRANPADAHSATREIMVAYFKEGTPEQWLDFLTKVREVLEGQGLTTGPQKYTMMRTLLKGDALSFFNQKATEVGNETVVNFEKMVKHMTYHIIPRRAVMYQQRYMLGGLRKPENMTTRKFCNRLTELNTYLALFPNDRFDAEGVPAGFSEDQKIPEHLLVNVIYFSLPKTWLTTMTTHGFDYVEREDPKGDLIKFCEERIEVLEHEQPAAKKARAEARGAVKATLKSPPYASKGNSKNPTNNKRKYDATKVCQIHGPGHSDSECKVIQAQIQSLKEQRAKAKPPMERTELQKMFNTFLSQNLVALLPKPQEKKRRQVTWTAAPADASKKSARKHAAVMAATQTPGDSDDEASLEDEAMQSFGALQLANDTEDSKPAALEESFNIEDVNPEEDLTDWEREYGIME
jgi:hypothetical protein